MAFCRCTSTGETSWKPKNAASFRSETGHHAAYVLRGIVDGMGCRVKYASTSCPVRNGLERGIIRSWLSCTTVRPDGQWQGGGKREEVRGTEAHTGAGVVREVGELRPPAVDVRFVVQHRNCPFLAPYILSWRRGRGAGGTYWTRRWRSRNRLPRLDRFPALVPRHRLLLL